MARTKSSQGRTSLRKTLKTLSTPAERIPEQQDLALEAPKCPQLEASKPRPRIGMISDFPNTADLQRSSTFRACLEKAADDINSKYGMTASPKEPHEERASSYKTSATTITFKSIPPRSYFRSVPVRSYAAMNTPAPPVCSPSGPQDRCQQKTGNRIPSHQLDRILEQSLRLRTPSLVGLS
ncbi:hypothetical protein HJFPF1_03484 [Paramyrothecium foliicola]|nr:hypothetical protein HJFPF1_03484 [Paramyrothecium foliicola]